MTLFPRERVTYVVTLSAPWSGTLGETLTPGDAMFMAWDRIQTLDPLYPGLTIWRRVGGPASATLTSVVNVTRTDNGGAVFEEVR